METSVDIDKEGGAIARSKGLIDIDLVKMVSETVWWKIWMKW
jgi:hypothetical protein